MSIASLSSSFRQQQLHSFEREREQPEQHFEQHHHHQQQLLESINGHREQVRNASLRVDVLECQIRDEAEKLFSLIGSSSHSIDSNSSCSHHHKMNEDDKNKNRSHPNNIHQLEASILQLENELLDEQRTLAEYEQLYQVSLEQTKQRWKQQIEEHQRGFRVCYRAVPQHSRTKSL